MDKFDDQYILLEELYEESRYPDFLIDKVKYLLVDFINFLETNPQQLEVVGDKIYDLIMNVNSLQDEFLINESEFDNLARECLFRNIEYIVQWFHLPINLEKVLAEREWD